MAGKTKDMKRGRGRPAVGEKRFVSASIDLALYERFQAHREETQRTPSGIITLALRQYFDRHDATKAGI